MRIQTRSVRRPIPGLLLVLALGGALLSLMALPTAPTRGGGTTHDVAIAIFAFDPGDLIIQVGDTVRWTNEDGADHTATSTAGPASFNSGGLATDETFEFTFTVAGVNQYQCAFHPSMTGTITVQGPATPTPVPTQAPTATAEATFVPDGALADSPGSQLGGLLWAVVLALAGLAVVSARGA